MKRLFTCFLIILITPILFAQDQLGTINFKPEGMDVAQPYFQKGLLLLHSFEYDDAAGQFQMATLLDPDFVMAYWGEAMCYNHPIWHNQNFKKGRGVLLKLGVSREDRAAYAKNELEKGFLNAVELLYEEDKSKLERDAAYAAAMKALSEKFPEENEVLSFYALSLLGLASNGRDLELYDRAASVCQQVLAKNPEHPGALHYLIHAYDDPERAHKGLEAATRYGKIAPDSEHALHMPSHIYVAMGMWHEMVKANELSWEAAEKRVQKKKLSLDDRGYHSFWWLAYGYLQQGKYQKAARMVEDMNRDARMSKSVRTRYHLTVMKAAYLVETGQWEHSIGKIEIPPQELNLVTKTIDLFVDGMGAYHKSDAARIDWIVRQINDLRSIESNQAARLDQNISQCGAYLQKPTNENDLKLAETMELELRALSALLKNENAQAIDLMEKAVRTEESVPFMFGPPVVVKPANELYGEILLKLGHPGKALEKFDRALERAPNRTLSLIGKYSAHQQMDDNAGVSKIKQLIMQNWKNADLGLTATLGT